MQEKAEKCSKFSSERRHIHLFAIINTLSCRRKYAKFSGFFLCCLKELFPAAAIIWFSYLGFKAG